MYVPLVSEPIPVYRNTSPPTLQYQDISMVDVSQYTLVVPAGTAIVV